MKSRITIEVNFDEGNLPVIQVLSQNSDDVRDRLISSFLQSLQHTSRWCNIIYMGNRAKYVPPLDLNDPIHCWHIVPIKPDELQKEMDLMYAVIHAQDSENTDGIGGGKIKLEEAVVTLKDELDKDKSEGSYYYSWQSNIAMAFIDEFSNPEYNKKGYPSKATIHKIANNAAKNFLNMLINQ